MMKYLISGFILFLVYLFNLIAIPRIFFLNTGPVPQWFSIIQIVIATLFILLGVQTIRLEKKYIAGILFFLLSIIVLIVFIVGRIHV